MDQHPITDYLAGMVFVLVYSYARFNTPPTNRSSTTAGRYFMALSLYMMAALATFMLLAECPHLVGYLFWGDKAESMSANLPPSLQSLSSPLVAALLMTVLLPNIPLLKSIDGWILRQLQGIAAIPYEVRRLSAELRGRPFITSTELQQETRRRLENDGFAACDVRFEAGSAPSQIWSALTALFVRLEGWESDRKMAAYVEEFGDSLRVLRARRQALLPKARICFRLLGGHEGLADTDSATEAIRRYTEDFSEQATQLRNDLIDFVSRGILHSEMTDTGRAARLSALGFPEPIIPATLTLNQMMGLFCMVGVLFLAGSVALGNKQGETHGVLFMKTVMISLIFSAAVACAVLPKEEWAFARRPKGGERPMAFYVVAGIMAVGISQVIGFIFNCLLERGIKDGATRWSYTYPWAVLTFCTAFGVAFLVDNIRSPRVPRWAWRTLEGLGQSAVMLAAASITYAWLAQRLDLLKPFHDYKQLPPFPLVLANSAIVGFFIGFLVPTWYREARREVSPTREPLLSAVDVAATRVV